MDLNQSSYGRYTAVAIILHWAIALLILGQIAAGLWMVDAIDSSDAATKQLAFQTIQVHKAVGLSVLLLSVLRLVWRLLHPAPPLPSGMSGIERFAADVSHFLLYGFMIAAPLTGWIMVSTSEEFSSLPTTYFGLFLVPHLPVELLGASVFSFLQSASYQAHEIISWLGLALLAAHVGAALKHHFVNQDAVLARMTPGVAPREPVFEPPAPRAGAIGKGLAGGLLVASASALALLFLLPGHGAVSAGAGAAPARQAEAAGDAPLWTPVMAESAITFTGAQLGSEFQGVFERWSAEIRFDPDRLSESRAEVVIETASAKTGDDQFDGTLPQADWFDVANHPEAVFSVVAFTAAEGGGGYVAEADLTIRGVTKRVALPFALSIDGTRAEMSGRVTLNRLDFEIGRASDGAGDYIAVEIPVDVTLIAERQGDG